MGNKNLGWNMHLWDIQMDHYQRKFLIDCSITGVMPVLPSLAADLMYKNPLFEY